jgi:Tol biopolymer transport system component
VLGYPLNAFAGPYPVCGVQPEDTDILGERRVRLSCASHLSVLGILAFLVLGATPIAADDALGDELKACPHRILFERYEDDNWELFVMNADGSGTENLTQTPGVHELYPQASPDGSRICFLVDSENDGKTVRSVYLMNADGSDRRLVAEMGRQPCWRPDGAQIAFVKQEFKRFQIKDFASKGLYVYDLATGEITEQPNTAINHLYNLNWSADGRWIVTTVHAGMGFSHGIIAIQLGGMGVYDLGIGGCRPCLSSDGKQVTWSQDDHTVCVADVDLAADVPKVTNVRTVHRHDTLHLYHPDFSPGGEYITFSMGPGGRMPAKGPGTHTEVAEMVGVRGNWNLFLKRADGQGDLVQLTSDESKSNKESEWLPDVSPRKEVL